MLDFFLAVYFYLVLPHWVVVASCRFSVLFLATPLVVLLIFLVVPIVAAAPMMTAPFPIPGSYVSYRLLALRIKQLTILQKSISWVFPS